MEVRRVCVLWYDSYLTYSQHDIRRERPDQEHRQHRRPVLVVVQPLRPAIAQVPRAEDKDDRRVRDGDERDPGEEPRADQPDRVLGRDEVEQRRRDCADVDTEVQPFLRRIVSQSCRDFERPSKALTKNVRSAAK